MGYKSQFKVQQVNVPQYLTDKIGFLQEDWRLSNFANKVLKIDFGSQTTQIEVIKATIEKYKRDRNYTDFDLLARS